MIFTIPAGVFKSGIIMLFFIQVVGYGDVIEERSKDDDGPHINTKD